MHECGETVSREAAAGICEKRLAAMRADERVAWALDTLPGNHVVTSSFGAQAAVMLHLMNTQYRGIPVILIDTGYLFPQTYRFVDELTARLDLNLEVFRPTVSAAWQEAKHGSRWEQGLAGIDDFNRENKIEPMQRALETLDVGTWFAGLRRSQSSVRNGRRFIESSGERWKVHPIADWTDRDVHRYLTRHGLPYHPLWYEGYVSIGDIPTTRRLADAGSLDGTRFNGLKRECGIHEMDFGRSAG